SDWLLPSPLPRSARCNAAPRWIRSPTVRPQTTKPLARSARLWSKPAMHNPKTATGERPVVLITGAAQRLGRHMALALAERGWDVMAHYRSSKDEAEATLQRLSGYGGHHCIAQADLSSEAETRQLFEHCVQQMGRV